VLCAVWTAESFASVWNSPVIFGVDRSSLSEQAFGAQKSCALPLAGSGKWSMVSRTLSKLGR
jgi:flavin reductase (DIM6/NTAB) family NADH-FMN oxidoreductase RutF